MLPMNLKICSTVHLQSKVDSDLGLGNSTLTLTLISKFFPCQLYTLEVIRKKKQHPFVHILKVVPHPVLDTHKVTFAWEDLNNTFVLEWVSTP